MNGKGDRAGRVINRVAILGAAIMIGLLVYLGLYLWVRSTHSKRLTYRDESQTAHAYDCTYFDEYERMDHFLYVVFVPACEVDQWLTGREYVKDKW